MRISTADLRDALKATAPAISGRPLAPVLAAVRIAALLDEAEFSATDYETWISTAIPTIDEPDAWAALVSHRTLSAIAKVIKAKEVDLDIDGSRLTIAAGTSSWTAPLIEGEAPQVAPLPAAFGTIEADALRRLVRFTAGAAGDQLSAKPEYRGGAFSTAGADLTLTMTDSYRVHSLSESFERATDSDVTVLPVADRLASVVGSLSGMVTLRADDENGVFAVSDGKTQITMATIAFDKLRWLDPIERAQGGVKATTTVSSAALIDALRATMPTADTFKGVTVTVESGLIVVEATGDNGGASIPVEGVQHDGKGLVVTCNPSYLLDALSALGGDEVTIGWTDPVKPILLTSASSAGQCVVMPIRTESSRWLA